MAKKPTFNQILLTLKQQVLTGKTYLAIAEGLLEWQRDEPNVIQTASVFFGLMINGSLEHAQMSIARLYDKTSGTITVRSMLQQAKQNTSTFVRGEPKEIADLIANGERMVTNLEPVLEAIRTRRNHWLAHLDPRKAANPNFQSKRSSLTFPDLQRALKETEKLLIDLCSLHDGTIGDLRFSGQDDYKVVLQRLRRYQCLLIREYEKQFGPWTGPRPKDCADGANDLI